MIPGYAVASVRVMAIALEVALAKSVSFPVVFPPLLANPIVYVVAVIIETYESAPAWAEAVGVPVTVLETKA